MNSRRVALLLLVFGIGLLAGSLATIYVTSMRNGLHSVYQFGAMEILDADVGRYYEKNQRVPSSLNELLAFSDSIHQPIRTDTRKAIAYFQLSPSQAMVCGLRRGTKAVIDIINCPNGTNVRVVSGVAGISTQEFRK